MCIKSIFSNNFATKNLFPVNFVNFAVYSIENSRNIINVVKYIYSRIEIIN